VDERAAEVAAIRAAAVGRSNAISVSLDETN
jgi:hypothetical protein